MAFLQPHSCTPCFGRFWESSSHQGCTQPKGRGDLFAEVARKGSLGHMGVSPAGCTPSEQLYGLKQGVFIRIARESLIYPSDLYYALACVLQD